MLLDFRRMSFGGFMKQINKANQLLNEKIGGAKGTEIDNRFHSMEKVIFFNSKLIILDKEIMQHELINS